MRRIKLAFRLREDDRLAVSAQEWFPGSDVLSARVTETTYDHEDLFLKLIIFADFDEELTRNLVVAVILSVADAKKSGAWIALEISPEQNEVLGLNLPPEPFGEPLQPLTRFNAGTESEVELPFVFPANPGYFFDFLMNAPTPFAMVSGSEQIITFINAAYLRILGRSARERLLGLPLRKAFPELANQQCLALLEQAYETGLPQVRERLPCSLRKQETGLFEEVYFDIVYHPVRDASGKVSSVMAQATDVTERVVAGQVRDNREQKLYRLWAELEAIYAAAPMGIAVIEASDLRLLRLNAIQARLLGAPAESLVGSILADLPAFPRDLLSLLQRAAAGERFADVAVEIATATSSPLRRRLSVSVRPALNGAGLVETLTLISVEVAGGGEAVGTLLTQYSA